MTNIPAIFATKVFNDKVMSERLPQETYRAFRTMIDSGKPLTLEIANVVANAMKDWAVENGATHFTHWFQPMTGITAEKHESFVSPTPEGGVVMEFSGKSLVRGEPDASSLPSGGLRATFEARGYTAWDPTSYAFIKDGSLCIPTAFCSYSGEVLDKKTPLLRSMQAVDKQAKRILKLFGKKAKRVITMVGAEQEYFLIDKKLCEKRIDLVNCGRTLFGAKPPKGQELDDHYYGVIQPRVSQYMKELDEELWKLGVLSKIKHNEVAPAQHELVPVYSTANITCDHNQLTMELMKSIAGKHDLVCLLHEKPFEGINGSGKHINWSLATDAGDNLLEPGGTPHENAQFLLFFTAILKAVDEYQDLLRVPVSSAGNDRRLGANEAPPAIVSVFVGEELKDILDAIDAGVIYKGKKALPFEVGVDVLPHFPKDTTDRNRTSPFAFTGNKFEFRMVGSNFSIAGPSFVLNTIVAEALKQYADVLEHSTNFQEDLSALIRKTISAHKRIIFNGNNYCEEWITEAAERGLLNLKSTVEALPYFITKKNIEVFERHGVLNAAEIHSRYEIFLENYAKTINIEALTMINMARKEIIPSVLTYLKEVSETLKCLKDAGCGCTDVESELISKISKRLSDLYALLKSLEAAIAHVGEVSGTLEAATYFRDVVFTNMMDLRAAADDLEMLVAKKYWAFPTYYDLLFSVK